MPAPVDTPLADAVADGWVDRRAPAFARPYLRLARIDRPIGSWLLMWPGWWALALAAGVSGNSVWTDLGLPDPVLLILFAVGAVAMRGAGCTYNDIVDRRHDAQVAHFFRGGQPEGRRPCRLHDSRARPELGGVVRHTHGGKREHAEDSGVDDEGLEVGAGRRWVEAVRVEQVVPELRAGGMHGRERGAHGCDLAQHTRTVRSRRARYKRASYVTQRTLGFCF